MDFQGDTDLKAVSTLLTIEVRWCSIFDEELFQLKFFNKVSERDEMDPSPSNLARSPLKISIWLKVWTPERQHDYVYE